jgi:hypothetical protein
MNLLLTAGSHQLAAVETQILYRHRPSPAVNLIYDHNKTPSIVLSSVLRPNSVHPGSQQ